MKKILATVAILLITAACQSDSIVPPKLSLDAAKKVTNDISIDYRAPPRAVADIIALFDKTDMTSELCFLRARPGEKEVQNVVESMHSSTHFGDSNSEWVKNYRRASYLEEVAWEEFLLGNFALAIKYLEDAIDYAPASYDGAVARYRAQIAFYYAYAGDFDAAESKIDPGFFRFATNPRIQARIQLHRRASRAAVAASKGNFKEAEAYYRKAMDIDDAADAIQFGEQLGFIKLALAEVIMLDGRLLEAENLIREELKNWAPDTTAIVVASLIKFGEVIYEQGRFEDAEKIARLAVKLFVPLCVTPANLLKAQAHRLLAKSFADQEKWQEAAREFDTIKNDFANYPDVFNRFFGRDVYRAVAMLRAGRIEEGRSNLQEALEQARGWLGNDHYRVGEITGFLAMAFDAEGARGKAIKEFARAAEILLLRSGKLDDETTATSARGHRLNLIVETYLGLLNDVQNSGAKSFNGGAPAAEALRIASFALNRKIQKSLAVSQVRATLTNPELADLARREQDTQNRVRALNATLAKILRQPKTDRRDTQIIALKAMVGNLRAARDTLVEEIKRRFPGYSDLIDPGFITYQEIQHLLRSNEAMIVTFVGAKSTFVWAIPKNGDLSFTRVSMPRKVLRRTVATLRRSLEPNATSFLNIPEFDAATAYELFKSILKPVESGWKHARNLLVVAHGPLGLFPLHAIPIEAPRQTGNSKLPFTAYRDLAWLVRAHNVAVLPSVTSLRTFRTLPNRHAAPRMFAGFGDPFFTEAHVMAARTELATLKTRRRFGVRGSRQTGRGGLDSIKLSTAKLSMLQRLPETGSEIREIAAALGADPAKDVFVGERASEAVVKATDLSDRRVVMFATHALVPGDLDGLDQPALALSSPKVTGSDEDGLLTMGEILGLKLNADWVVLSACNTAAGDGKGAEAISGLGRAFFYAGARSLLVTHWPVETTSARELTTSLFKLQAANDNLSRAEALRQAQLKMIDEGTLKDPATGRPVASYAHPIFWAPFEIVGEGG